MVEMRWVWHNLENGAPPTGAVCVDSDGRLYQKLQYRTLITVYDHGQSGMMPAMRHELTPWKDVPHSGVMHPNASVSGAEPQAERPTRRESYTYDAKGEGNE